MDIAIDIGNSYTKIGVFVSNTLQEVLTVAVLTPQTAKELVQRFKPQKIIFSSVAADAGKVASYFAGTTCVLFTQSTSVPIKNAYASPQTLGLDRLAAAIGATAQHAGSSMVIDAGSCLTMDFVQNGDTFIGGVISPGLHMRFNSLHTFTQKLPLLQPDGAFAATLGNTTTTAMIAGVQLGFIEEIKGTIARYEQQYGQFKIIVCGGDSSFLEGYLKNSIFAKRIIYSPHLVLMGLYAVLQHHE